MLENNQIGEFFEPHLAQNSHCISTFGRNVYVEISFQGRNTTKIPKLYFKSPKSYYLKMCLFYPKSVENVAKAVKKQSNWSKKHPN